MATILLFMIIFIALILLIIKKEYLLYYFVFLYPILPEYLAISISSSLPLFTASRILLIILMVATFSRGKVKIKKNIFKEKYFGKAFLFYICCETVVAIAHISEMASIKTYISVILENVIFYYVLLIHINSKRKFEGCMKALLCGAALVFTMGMLEPITKVNLAATFLDTGSRETLLMSSYVRYDSVRAVFSFGHAIALGVYCIALLPLIMYKINQTKKIQFYLLYLLGIICLIMTMSRGVIAIFGVLFGISLFKLNRNERMGYWKILGVGIISGFLLIVLSPEMFSVAQETVFATLNAFGGKFTVSDSGGNDYAVLSRFSQFSMLPQVLKKYPLFGGGTGYIFNNDIFVYAGSRRFIAESIDMEYLSMLINRGIVGFLGGTGLYITLLKLSHRMSKIYKDRLCNAFFYSFLSIILAYFTVAQLTTGRILWMLIVLFISYRRIFLNDSKRGN